MDLLLLRHGETEWNLTGRMQGLSDTRLTQSGIEQARQALTSLPTFSQVWTSPLQRARLTAEAIADSQSIPCWVDERLIERSWGAWEGMLPKDVDQKWPGWRESGRKPDGYEHDESVFSRFLDWRDAITYDDSSTPLVAVTHGGFMSAVVRILGGSDSGYKNLEGVWIGGFEERPFIRRHEEFIPNARKLTR